jgi:hypothetical protein
VDRQQNMAGKISGTGAGNTITTGSTTAGNHDRVNMVDNFNVLADGPNKFDDTVVGFSQGSGDTIKLGGSDTASFALVHSAQVNGGTDTLITLNDGSTILMKGVGHIDGSIFS